MNGFMKMLMASAAFFAVAIDNVSCVPISLEVKTVVGKQKTLNNVDTTDTVDQLEDKICELFSLPSDGFKDSFKLIYNRRLLRGGTLADHDVTNGCTIQIAPILRCD
jgi:hypothetical protein